MIQFNFISHNQTALCLCHSINTQSLIHLFIFFEFGTRFQFFVKNYFIFCYVFNGTLNRTCAIIHLTLFDVKRMHYFILWFWKKKKNRSMYKCIRAERVKPCSFSMRFTFITSSSQTLLLLCFIFVSFFYFLPFWMLKTVLLIFCFGHLSYVFFLLRCVFDFAFNFNFPCIFTRNWVFFSFRLVLNIPTFRVEHALIFILAQLIPTGFITKTHFIMRKNNFFPMKIFKIDARVIMKKKTEIHLENRKWKKNKPF